MIPPARVRLLRDLPVRPDRDYVLYWMIGARRLSHSFALDQALAHARAHNKPLLLFEALWADYPHASPRFHQFILDGMREHARALAGSGVTYLPYVEPVRGAGRGLLRALTKRATVAVTDDAWAFHYPALLEAGAQASNCRLEAVDGQTLLPVRSAPKCYRRAHDFRRHLHKAFLSAWPELPDARPLEGVTPKGSPIDLSHVARWRVPDIQEPGLVEAISTLDTRVPVCELTGGSSAARMQLDRFCAQRLDSYASRGRHPDEAATSELSAYLHMGHIAVHEIVDRLLADSGWTPERARPEASGKQTGWWGLDEDREAYLDQLLTWRGLAQHACVFGPDPSTYEGLPAWAKATLNDHRDDPRSDLVPLDALHEAASPDPLWNAAQRELRSTGRIANALRMLWGKCVIAWSASPEEAFDRLIVLNDRWALDGRDPNGYLNISWVFGRFDRAWGPERPIFGKVRYMNSRSARKKLRLRAYLARFGGADSS